MLKLNLQQFATVAEQTVHAGHTILLRIEGTIVGRAQGIDGERNFGTEGLYEIGSIMPFEYVNLRYEGSINLERYFVRTNDLKKLGIVSMAEEILTKGIITIEVVDKYTGGIIRSYHGCSQASGRETFRVNSIAGEAATFNYLFARNGA